MPLLELYFLEKPQQELLTLLGWCPPPNLTDPLTGEQLSVEPRLKLMRFNFEEKIKYLMDYRLDFDSPSSHIEQFFA